MTAARCCPVTPMLLLALASGAAAQDPSARWRTLHTEHFRIHFQPAYRAVAGETAREAERAYGLLASELHAPRGIIDLTLADDVDVPNGFASTYPSNRVTLLLVPPVADPGLQDYDSWVRLVAVHELTHVFHLDRSRGIWAVLQSMFGRAPGLFPNEYQPSWVVEGLATYYESRFTGAGRAVGSFHRQVTAADAAAGTARSSWDARFFTRWPDGLAPYAYGSRFFKDLGRRAGDSLVPRFIEATGGQLIPFRVGSQLRRAGSPRSLGDDWARAIAGAIPTSGSASSSRRIVGSLRSAPVPRVSPDGRSVAYLHDDGRGAPRLRVADVASWRVLRSHRVTGEVSYDWLGDTLIVAQLEFTDRWHIRSDLWHWLPDGAWRRATRGARLIEPRGGRVGAAIALGPGDNAPAVAGVPDPPGTTWGAIVPSPDGRWVAATRHREGRWALVRWPAAAPESIVVLVEPPGVVTDPLWVRGGRGLLYVADADGFPQVHSWTPDGGVAQLTTEPLGARSPAMLPSDTMLFTTLASDGWELRAASPPATRHEPVAVAPAPVAFDSAPAVVTRETGYDAWPSLRPRFWIPLGRDAGAAGAFFGGITAGSDAVGRYVYLIEGLLSVKPARAEGRVALVTRALGNPTLDASASNNWHVIGSTGGRLLLNDELDAAIGATVVTRRWRTVASIRLAAEYEGTRFAVTPDTTVTAVCAGCLPEDFVGGSVGLAVGHVITAPLTVSRQDGFVASMLYRRREEQGTARWSNEVRGRLALYARLGPRLGGFAHPVLAVRLAAGAIDGSIRHSFAVGGVSSEALDVGFGQTVSLGTARAFPVRGYAGGTVRGRRAATITLEYRVPLALVGKGVGHLPFGVDKFSLAVFGDAGDAWDSGQPARLHRLRSAGVELVSDLTLSYDFPLRLRVGVAQPAVGSPQAYAAFTADF
ncbi:MAG TPA: hypothetical protein VGQ06_08965 [Gemmatimonadales bacterium]|jgi:hypothetical protein|nr:hypothetical protein [Gemmatimonadales bacterium]